MKREKTHVKLIVDSDNTLMVPEFNYSESTFIGLTVDSNGYLCAILEPIEHHITIQDEDFYDDGDYAEREVMDTFEYFNQDY